MHGVRWCSGLRGVVCFAFLSPQGPAEGGLGNHVFVPRRVVWVASVMDVWAGLARPGDFVCIAQLSLDVPSRGDDVGVLSSSPVRCLRRTRWRSWC